MGPHVVLLGRTVRLATGVLVGRTVLVMPLLGGMLAPGAGLDAGAGARGLLGLTGVAAV